MNNHNNIKHPHAGIKDYLAGVVYFIVIETVLDVRNSCKNIRLSIRYNQSITTNKSSMNYIIEQI